MKKKIALLATITVLAGTLSACGKNAVYLSEMKASDYVTLGEYTGIEVTESEPTVAEGYVDAYISYFLSQRAVTTEVTDRAVENGDTVNIDYAGYQDGVAFEGGTAQGQDLTIGSGAFIPGFEEGLIGADIGDTVTLDLTFPDDYGNEEMAGVSVSFDVTINSISVVETPELTDKLVQELGLEDCSTVEDFRDYVYEMFYADAVSTYNRALKNDITEAVMANCVFKEPPEKMVERYYDILIDGMKAEASSNNMDLDTYMQSYYNMDAETYPESLKEEAKMMAEQYIMFQAIADVEGLNMTEEEIAQAMEEKVTSYGYASVEEFEEQIDADTFKEYLMADEVMEFLIDNAVIHTETVEE